jgi:hypothetical protein
MGRLGIARCTWMEWKARRKMWERVDTKRRKCVRAELAGSASGKRLADGWRGKGDGDNKQERGKGDGDKSGC